MPLMTLKCSSSQQTAMGAPVLCPLENASMIQCSHWTMMPCFHVKWRWVHVLQVGEHRSCKPLAQAHHVRYGQAQP